MHLRGAFQKNRAQESIRQFAEHASAIARAGVTAHGASVFKVLKRFKRKFNNTVAGLTRKRHHTRKPAGIVLFRGVIETHASWALM